MYGKYIIHCCVLGFRAAVAFTYQRGTQRVCVVYIYHVVCVYHMAPSVWEMFHSSSLSYTLRLLIHCVMLQRMRKRVVQEGSSSFVTGSKDPTTAADVCMSVKMPEGDVDAFRKVAERLRNPLDMVRTMMSSTVSMAREPATAVDAPAAASASASGSETTTEDDDEEEDWVARGPLSDRKGKGKSRPTALQHTLFARGRNTATPERVASEAGATSQPVVVVAAEPPSATPMVMAAAGRGAMETVGRK